MSAYYSLDIGSDPVDDHLHPEWANICFNLSGRWTRSIEEGTVDTDALHGPTLFGPTFRVARITASPGALLWGIDLLPLGWSSFFSLTAKTLVNRTVPLEDQWGDTGLALLSALRADRNDGQRAARVDAFLLARLAESQEKVHPSVARIQAVIHSKEIATVATLAREVGVSERTLERLCPRYFGFAPKPLLRRQRFLRTLEHLESRPGRTLIDRLEDGYFDQAHFVREFHAFMGSSPSAYFARPRELMRLAGDERRRFLGQSLEGVDTPYSEAEGRSAH